MKQKYEILIVTLLFLAVCYLYHGQQRIKLNKGQGWDGAHYYPIAEQFQKGLSQIDGELPYVKRIGTLFLVGIYSKITRADLLHSAFIINLTGTFITVILLLFWLRIFIDIVWIRGLLLLLFMMNWQAPLRYSFYCSMTTDAWGSVFFVAGLLLLHGIRRSHQNNKIIFWHVLAFSAIVAVGNLFRESNAVLAIAILFLFYPLKGLNINQNTLTISHGIKIIKQIWNQYFVKQTIILFLPIITVILTNIIVSSYTVIDHQNGYSYIRTIFIWFYEKSLPEYLLGICIAFGPLILLLPLFYKEFKLLFTEKQELFILLIASLVFGFIGGSDTERITFMSGFPIFFILIGISIKSIFNSSQRWWLHVLLILQTIAYRFYWIIPDYPTETKYVPIPFFGLIGNDFQSLFLYSHHGHYVINTILFLEYLILFLATFYVIHNKITLKCLNLLKK